MPNQVPPSGPLDADIMIIGEAPGKTEAEQGAPFVGASGQLLTKLLRSAGINRKDCFITNVARVRPPSNNIEAFFMSKTEAKKMGLDDPNLARVQSHRTTYPKEEILNGLKALEEEITGVRPRILIPVGAVALWALNRETSIDSWAGSLLAGPLENSWIIPTYHPARVLRQYYLRNITISDLRRAKRQLTDPIPEPAWDFKIFPTFLGVMERLDNWIKREDTFDLACDIETTYTHFIGCIGFADSETSAICIPFISNTFPYTYWNETDELEIIIRIRKLLSRPNTNIIGQNFAFDAQYTARDWGIISNSIDDTMVGHHVCFPGTPKGLDYLSRMYLPFHRYWKDEGKFIDERRDLGQWFTYNCKDCCATYGIMLRLREQIKHFNLEDQYRFQMRMWPRLIRTMIRGVNINKRKKDDFTVDAALAIQDIDSDLNLISKDLLPSSAKTPWWRSPKQTAYILYDLLRFPVQTKRTNKGRSVTTDDAALKKLRGKDPILIPIIDRILARRSLSVFLKTFLMARLGDDNRMRTTYDLTGTETFRLASRGDSFGDGTNLQNIPRLR